VQCQQHSKKTAFCHFSSSIRLSISGKVLSGNRKNVLSSKHNNSKEVMDEEEDASVFSAFTNQSTRASGNPHVTNAIYSIGQITTLEEYGPILVALEERIKSMMDAEVKQYGWTKTSNYRNECKRCNKHTGLFNFILFLNSLSQSIILNLQL
jgi:hypothetical protein